MPKISFVLPAYKARFLDQAIDSILGQSYADFELIIVDDASPENLREIVNPYNDSRIRYFRNTENIGGRNLVEQWNHSIQYAQGEYIVLAADDDTYHPRFLEKCLLLAEKYPDVQLIRSRVEHIDEENKTIGIDGILPEYCSKYQFLYYWVQATAFTCIGNYMFKAAALLRKGFIDFPFGYGADVASTIMMGEKGVANTEEMLFRFRKSEIHLSGSKKHWKPRLRATTMLYRWLMNLGYSQPENGLDAFCYSQTGAQTLYTKCKHDYYNQVIRHLPFSQILSIRDCELISNTDRISMFLRFCADKLRR